MLKFHPEPGTILICDYSTGFRLPDSEEMWVKADMLATIGFGRLDLVRTGRDPFGKRKYLTPQLEPAALQIVYQCVLHAIGLSHLTWPEK